MIRPAFGADTAEWGKASPVNFVRAGQPPFRLVNGGGFTDASLVRQANAFVARLKQKGITNYQASITPGAGHVELIQNVGRTGDPTTRAVRDFIRKVTGA